MDFFEKVGRKAIGSRLRMITDKVTEDAAKIYRLYDIDLQPKWFPVFYTLTQCRQATITEIAVEIGHSHPSVSKIVSEMSKAGIVLEKKDKNDGRRNQITLSEKGNEYVEKMVEQYGDVEKAIEEIAAQTRNDLWKAIEEWDFMLEQKSLYRRVQEHKKQRESESVTIVPFNSQYKEVFKTLNEEWIRQYFKMEASDYKSLDNPSENIIAKGGEILVALYKNEPMGVCALIKMDDPVYQYEMAKMAVSPKAQGKNIGFILGNAIIDAARKKGAKKIYLESNTVLKPAINLYHKLGWKKVVGHASPYERCNIQMEFIIDGTE